MIPRALCSLDFGHVDIPYRLGHSANQLNHWEMNMKIVTVAHVREASERLGISYQEIANIYGFVPTLLQEYLASAQTQEDRMYVIRVAPPGSLVETQALRAYLEHATTEEERAFVLRRAHPGSEARALVIKALCDSLSEIRPAAVEEFYRVLLKC